MVKLHSPKIFTNKVKMQEIRNGNITSYTETVTSETEPISIAYSGPLGKSFGNEALESKKTLELNPGQTAEFTSEEAKFLIGRYEFLERVADEEETPSLGDKTPVEDEIPTNYMKLKAYAKAKGVAVENTDKKDDLLRKLAELE